MGTDRRHPPPGVEVTRRGQRLGEIALPARLVDRLHVCGRARHRVVGRGQPRRHRGQEVLAGLPQRRTGGRQLRIPDVEGEGRVGVEAAVRGSQQRVALLEDPVEIGAERVVAGMTTHQRLIDPGPPHRRAGLHQLQVVGGEHCHLHDAEQVSGPRQALAVDLDAVAADPRDLDLDQLLATVGRLDRRPHDRGIGAVADQGIVGNPAERTHARDPTDRLEQVRLPLAVLAHDGGEAVGERDLDRFIGPEVHEFERPDQHRRPNYLSRRGLRRDVS